MENKRLQYLLQPGVEFVQFFLIWRLEPLHRLFIPKGIGEYDESKKVYELAKEAENLRRGIQEQYVGEVYGLQSHHQRNSRQDTQEVLTQDSAAVFPDRAVDNEAEKNLEHKSDCMVAHEVIMFSSQDLPNDWSRHNRNHHNGSRELSPRSFCIAKNPPVQISKHPELEDRNRCIPGLKSIEVLDGLETVYGYDHRKNGRSDESEAYITIENRKVTEHPIPICSIQDQTQEEQNYSPQEIREAHLAQD